MVSMFSRSQRVAQELRKKIAHILQHSINDPRLNMMVTVSSVEVSRDISYAKVFVTFLNDQDEEIIKNSLQVLKAASGYIRILLRKTLYLHNIPELIFFYDKSFLEGIRMSNLVSNAIKKDIAKRRSKLLSKDY